MLPLDGDLWLTTDTVAWGLIDFEEMETLEDEITAPGTTLNAHPACDPITGECFVQYPCPMTKKEVISDQVCVGRLVTSEEEDRHGKKKTKHLDVIELSRQTMDAKKLIQHSHSPCVTPNYVVSKLDAFEKADSRRKEYGGMLKNLHQAEGHEWLLHDRRTNTSTLLTSELGFVNNHFWNCFETEKGVVVQSVATTSDYLDMYFRDNLSTDTYFKWEEAFQDPITCTVPHSNSDSQTVECSPLGKGDILFDYPTFNPYFKMNPAYQYFYGISPTATAPPAADGSRKPSAFFDRLIKFDAQTGLPLLQWSSPGMYLTEANFVPRSPESAEDDGVLLSVLYDSVTDASRLGVFDAQSLTLVDSYDLHGVVPFHAHGMVCQDGKCFSNP